MKFPFFNWLTGKLIVEIEIPDDTEERFRCRVALEIGTRSKQTFAYASLVGARLDGARLDGASLAYASLVGARLDGASLAYASLVGARLDGASLDGASLDYARLDGASLDGASLVGARLNGARGEKLTLKGQRPVVWFGPIGRDRRTVYAFQTDAGAYVRAGCFWDTMERFKKQVAETHGANEHGREYAAFVTLAEAHFAMWPADDVAEKAGP